MPVRAMTVPRLSCELLWRGTQEEGGARGVSTLDSARMRGRKEVVERLKGPHFTKRSWCERNKS